MRGYIRLHWQAQKLKLIQLSLTQYTQLERENTLWYVKPMATLFHFTQISKYWEVNDLRIDREKKNTRNSNFNGFRNRAIDVRDPS